MLAIAEQLISGDENLHVLMITGSPMLHSFRISPGIDFLKLPCLSRNIEGEYAARSLPLDKEKLLLMRSKIITTTMLNYKPDLILVDKKPLV